MHVLGSSRYLKCHAFNNVANQLTDLNISFRTVSHPQCGIMCVHTYVIMYIYKCIYIYTERERENKSSYNMAIKNWICLCTHVHQSVTGHCYIFKHPNLVRISH